MGTLVCLDLFCQGGCWRWEFDRATRETRPATGSRPKSWGRFEGALDEAEFCANLGCWRLRDSVIANACASVASFSHFTLPPTRNSQDAGLTTDAPARTPLCLRTMPLLQLQQGLAGCSPSSRDQEAGRGGRWSDGLGHRIGRGEDSPGACNRRGQFAKELGQGSGLRRYSSTVWQYIIEGQELTTRLRQTPSKGRLQTKALPV